MAKKKQILERVKIESVAAEGKCVARHEGKVIFVDKVAPGDVVDLKLFKKKKNFSQGSPIHFHKYSEDRASPFCSHYGTCGGCKWQHIDYSKQLEFKRQQVIDQLTRIGNIDLPEINKTISSENIDFYRNKLEYTFSNKRWLTQEEIKSGEDLNREGLGFHIPGRFDKVLDIEKCFLQASPSNEIRLEVKKIAQEEGFTFYDLLGHTGFLRNLIIRTSNTGQVMVILQVAEDKVDQIHLILDKLEEKFPAITSFNYIINQKKNETYGDQEIVNYKGLPYIEEIMQKPGGDGDLTFRVGPKSFYQTNSDQAEKLYKIAWQLADLSGDELVYDLYTGTGTIACYIAKEAKHVIGIEYVEEAVLDGQKNAKLNNIENAEFHAGDMKDLLSMEFMQEKGFPDVVITDPPRAGMHEDVCKALLAASPKKIVYVSCNPATQARDAAILSEKYEVTAVQPVDMFPHTHHVENVMLFVLK